MKRINYIKIFKIAFGCCFAFFLAQHLHLNYSTSVITITLLSILNTRKDTLQMAGKRYLAFFTASIVSLTVFPLLHYSLFSLFLFLLVYFSLCQAGNFTEGASMSTVLTLHLWKAGTITLSSLFNELSLMTIGIVMGIIVNLYMPNRISQIRSAQKKIEHSISSVLLSMSEAIFRDTPDNSIESLLDSLEKTLTTALFYAQYTERNYVFKDMSYYVSYMKMRFSQYELLKRINSNLPRLQESYEQTILVSDFMKKTAASMDEYNNARSLLSYLDRLKLQFRSAPLPDSRAEFESRAVLYEIVNELQELLLLKQKFSANLTPYQIRTFWNNTKKF